MYYCNVPDKRKKKNNKKKTWCFDKLVPKLENELKHS